jgi:hypothetical protein
MSNPYGRDYQKKSPLECFREEYGDRKITRSQLSKEDSGLYCALNEWEQMDKAIPKRGYRGYTSPLECFRVEFKGRKMTRYGLIKEDSGLYSSLKNWEQLDEAIPEKSGASYRGYASPLECFNAKFKGKKITRNQLRKRDQKLCEILYRRKQMDEAIPKEPTNYRGYASPLECFRAKFGKRKKKISRAELERVDSKLFSSLYRWKQLEEAIPEKHGNSYRGYSSPLECFRTTFKGRKIQRGQLCEEDFALYAALLRYEQMDEAIPEKWGKPMERPEERKAKLETILRRYAHAGGAN